MLETIGPTLVCSAITEDKKFQRALIDATHIDRLNLGADADDPAQLAAAARGQHRRFPVPRPGLPVRQGNDQDMMTVPIFVGRPSQAVQAGADGLGRPSYENVTPD